MLLFVLSAVSQTDALFTGTVPAEIPTFSVTLSGAAPFYAAMQVGGQWVTDRNQEIKPTQEVEFVPDIPWRTHEVVRTSMRRAAVSYEAPAMRRERLGRCRRKLRSGVGLPGCLFRGAMLARARRRQVRNHFVAERRLKFAPKLRFDRRN